MPLAAGDKLGPYQALAPIGAGAPSMSRSIQVFAQTVASKQYRRYGILLADILAWVSGTLMGGSQSEQEDRASRVLPGKFLPRTKAKNCFIADAESAILGRSNK
jgi:hypothetical protein